MAKKTIYLSGSTTISPTKSNIFNLFGLFLVIFSGLQLHIYFNQYPHTGLHIDLINNFHFWNIIILFGVGVWFLLLGLKLISKKANQYIRFEKDKIVYKPSYLKEAKSIDIDKLNEIVFSETWILCISDKEKFMVDLSWVPLHLSKRIKAVMKKISDKRQITLRGQVK